MNYPYSRAPGKRLLYRKLLRDAIMAGHKVLVVRCDKPSILAHLVDGKVTWTKRLPPKPKLNAVLIDELGIYYDE